MTVKKSIFKNKFLIGFVLFIGILLILQFVVNSKYSFPEPTPFKGNYIYNPYHNIDKTKWEKANFHAHTMKFLDPAKKIARSAVILDSTYRSLGYNIVGISDYQRVNNYEIKNKWFVPEYEHGYQYYKNHQLVLNAKKINWLDYPFRQTLDNKQFVIDQLKKDTAVFVAIVHPGYRKALSNHDFKYLSNYNCLEIANHDRLFTEFYDTILSNGHPVFVMADDDSHKLNDIKEVGISFNLINTDLVSDSVLKALVTGRSVAVKFNVSPYKTNEEKRVALFKLPQISDIIFRSDTLSVILNQPVKTIRFIGQGGWDKAVISDSSKGSCNFSPQDTYIRTEIECYDGTMYFLNPLLRWDGIRLTYYSPSVNVLATWVWRSALIIIVLIIIMSSVMIHTKTKND
jgi:hypothetical protein